MSVDYRAVLEALKAAHGSNAKLAEALGYSEKTVQDWLTKDREELGRLSPEKLKNLLTLAASRGVEPDRHAIGPMLWDPLLNFEKNSRRPIGQPPAAIRPFVDHQTEFLGYRIASPVGVGPSALTSNVGQVRFWASSGVDVITVRSLRSSAIAPAGIPNLLVAMKPVELDGDKPVDVEVAGEWDERKIDNGILSLYLGSSPPPAVWQTNFRAANLNLAGNQLLILSLVGGGVETASESELVLNWKRVSSLGTEAGARVIELNLSAPRSAGGVSPSDKPLCFDLPLTAKVCEEVRATVGESTKILLKIRWMPTAALETLVNTTVALGFADGISAINAEGVFPFLRRGSSNLRLWEKEVCIGGKPLLPLGLQCVGTLSSIRARLGLKNMAIVGLGGVSTFEDFQAYRHMGADVVQLVSQCFVDSYAPFKIRRLLDDEVRKNDQVNDHDHDIILLTFAKAARVIEQWPGMTQSKKEKVQRITQDEMVQWMRRRDHTSSLGPMRSKSLSVEDCIRLIQARLI
jgi:dihydroorotate dehydrogenase